MITKMLLMNGRLVGPVLSPDQEVMDSMRNGILGMSIDFVDYECNCAEKMADQDMFTKAELLKILNCPVRH